MPSCSREPHLMTRLRLPPSQVRYPLSLRHVKTLITYCAELATLKLPNSALVKLVQSTPPPSTSPPSTPTPSPTQKNHPKKKKKCPCLASLGHAPLTLHLLILSSDQPRPHLNPLARNLQLNLSVSPLLQSVL